MTEALYYLLAFAIVIGVLVVVHELGHYAAARQCNVKVLRFSFGFGPVIFRTVRGVDRTEWVLSLIPLGGYVKMSDEREGNVPVADVLRSFNRQSLGRRVFIVAAGPVANFLMAILLYWVVFLSGTQELKPWLGAPPQGTPAFALGIRAGDVVLAVDEQPVLSWGDLRWLLLDRASHQESVRLTVQTPGQDGRTLNLPLDVVATSGWEGDPVSGLGLDVFRPSFPARLGRVTEGGAADLAGLQPGDLIESVDGKTVQDWADFVQRVRASEGKPLQIDFQRGRDFYTTEAVPIKTSADGGAAYPRLGVALAEPDGGFPESTHLVRYSPLAAASKALRETWEKSLFSLRMFGKMLLGEVSWKNLSGPVTIADYAGKSAKMGLDYYLKFMAMVSISLGVLNLLPVPVLDGGHLLYYAIEFIRQKPLSDRAMEIGQRIGVALVLTLMIFAFFNDLNRLLSG